MKHKDYWRGRARNITKEEIVRNKVRRWENFWFNYSHFTTVNFSHIFGNADTNNRIMSDIFLDRKLAQKYFMRL